MDIYKTIILGTMTGILSSGLIWIFVRGFNHRFIPWYQSIIYRGTNIQDTWVGVEENTLGDSPLRFNHTVKINQKGHKVKGTISLENCYEDKSRNSTSNYCFTGEISDNNLIVCYQRQNNKTIGMGAYLLKITLQGKALEGSYVFMKGSGEISSSNNVLLIRMK